ncbi:MAG TPA: hypothetical protein VMU86_02865 [Steroidobacteraceae bacterium]|nr:hypothetical protein [Steroidobacteraceae bacterium]
MIPTIPGGVFVAKRLRFAPALGAVALVATLLANGTAVAATRAPHRPPKRATLCLQSGGGYLRARLGGSLNIDIAWPNRGTWCAGERKDHPPGIRMSFRRANGARPRLLFLFGLTGVREGKPLREGRVNVTVIDEGDGRVFGTLGDRRCTIDSLTQRRLRAPHTYRVEAHGFCTEPAHAVHGRGAILVSRFDFAGPVNYADY